MLILGLLIAGTFVETVPRKILVILDNPIGLSVLFLFPLYGVSDVMVILLAAAKYFTDFDEYVAACPPCLGSP